MNIKEFITFVNELIEGIARIVLTRPILILRGKTIKKYIPGVNGFLFIDSYKLDLVNYQPIYDDEDYKVVVKNYEIEIIDKNGQIVQLIKGQFISDDKA